MRITTAIKNMRDILANMVLIITLVMAPVSCLTACGDAGIPDTPSDIQARPEDTGSPEEDQPYDAQSMQEGAEAFDASAAPEWSEIGSPVREPLSYAKQYSADRYEEGYILITIAEQDRFLVVPEGKPVPLHVDSDITVIQQPVTHIYLVASAVMDMFRAIDGLDSIRLSGTDADGWCMKEVSEAMKAGSILYAGKYNAPDYELILSEGCGLAIENLMIDHSPEVREKLESFGIPVMVDYSSYESHPLGRVEWVKLYGILLGKEAEAEAVFHEQVQILQAIEEESAESRQAPEEAEGTAGESAENGHAAGTDKTVAFFYIASNGAVNVRKSSDYVPRMIELAGGRYIFDDLGEMDSHSSSITMQMEEFYAGAKDADYIIYNSAIDGELQTVDELTDKCALLSEFKAVQEGNVYCTTRNLYQESMSIGIMIGDIHKMLTGGSGMQYLYRLDN